MTFDSIRAVAILALPAVLGTALVLYATREGAPAHFLDSFQYTQSARNLAAGRGLLVTSREGNPELVRLREFPPLFPAFLAVLVVAGVDPWEGSRWLNAALFGGCVAVVMASVYWGSEKRRVAALLAGFATALSAPLLEEASWIMSETLFLVLTFTGLAFLATYLDGADRKRLLAASVLFGAASLTRYAGVALAGVGLVPLLLQKGRPLIRRARDCVVLILLSCGPLALWLLWNAVTAGARTAREVDFHIPATRRLFTGLETISSWVLTDLLRSPSIGALLAVVLAVGLGCSLWRYVRSKHEGDHAPSSSLPVLMGVFCGVYVAFIVTSMTFVDARIPLNNRLLCPVYLAALVWVYSGNKDLLSRLSPGKASDRASALVRVAILVVILVGAVRWLGVDPASREAANAPGYSSPETARLLDSIPSGAAIYSNASDLVYLSTGRDAFAIPKYMNLYTGRPNAKYRDQLAIMRETMARSGGVLVYWHDIRLRHREKLTPSEADLGRDLGLVIVATSSHCTLYALSEAPRE